MNSADRSIVFGGEGGGVLLIFRVGNSTLKMEAQIVSKKSRYLCIILCISTSRKTIILQATCDNPKRHSSETRLSNCSDFKTSVVKVAGGKPQIATDIADRLYLKQVCLMHVERGKGKNVYVINHHALTNDWGVAVMLVAFDVCMTVHH